VRDGGIEYGMDVIEVTEFTDEIMAAFNALLPQLSSSCPGISSRELQEIIEAPACRLLVAREGGVIVGSLTLVLFRIPTGMRAWIEDVVVDESARGKGAGLLLTQEALKLAATAGARTVDLTSRPDRVAANNLYRKAGFTQRETNVYRHKIR